LKFTDFALDPVLLRGVSDLGFTEPTPIQQAAIPPGLDGEDILAAAMTGSGKTVAFLLPILQQLLERKRGVTRVLVLVPTRELALQVDEELRALARHTRIRSATVFGGVSPRPQENALRRGVDVVVATPGRLLDLMQQPWLNFRGLDTLVLDEADRMLDMGFLPDVKRILRQLPERRQTLLFSATLPQPIVQLSRELLVEPVRIDVERKAAPATGVEQHVLPVPEQLKRALLLEMLRRDHVETALVFTRTKHRANRLAEYLEKAGIACDRIHGNRSQNQRQQALQAFKEGKLSVLVATDIAARGIDVEALPHVINFDVPNQPEDYIHRVGRTARARSTGVALTFASPAESGGLQAIERAVGRRIPRRHLEGFDYDARPAERFEVPLNERLAKMRADRAAARTRTAAKDAAKGRPGNAGPERQGDAENPGRPRRRRRRRPVGAGRGPSGRGRAAAGARR
jgi:ATP-dependent RNA helicase RhlE